MACLGIDAATHSSLCVEMHVIHCRWTPREFSPGVHSRRAVVKALAGDLDKMTNGSLGDLTGTAFEIVVGYAC